MSPSDVPAATLLIAGVSLFLRPPLCLRDGLAIGSSLPSSNVRDGVTDYSKCKPNGTHGATNEEVKRYIDFAAKNGLQEVLGFTFNIIWA